MSDVIFALATANGRSGVSILRLSGTGVVKLVENYVGNGLKLPGRSLRKFYDRNNLIDELLVLTFLEGSSFTGEEVVELHCHGSIAVVSALLRIFSKNKKARLAEPGEFTRKALENGCLDLTQVEGLADLINAETEAQRSLATDVFSGKLSKIVEKWRKNLIRAAALVEATIDFSDEDIPTNIIIEVLKILQVINSELKLEIDGSYVAERIRNGFEVAIIGEPNVGKSTLLNKLAKREAAITSEIAGTTRDIIEVKMDINGLAVTFLDTAGLRETRDEIESLGINLTRKRSKQADLRIFLTDNGDISNLGVNKVDDDFIIINKADLKKSNTMWLSVSGKSGLGIDVLLKKISVILSKRTSIVLTATHERHRVGMIKASFHIESGLDLINKGSEFTELIAAEIRQSILLLSLIIGKVDVENLLDEIFASFCLGK